MTGREFIEEYGDPGGWSDARYEQYEHIATPGGQPVPDEVIAFLKQPPPATTVEDRPDGSKVLHITPAA